MPDTTAPIKLGADCFGQRVDWTDYLAAMELAEELGYDSLWTPDHVLPSSGDLHDLIGDPAMVVETDRVLMDHCEAIGRDEREIERTEALGWPIIRDDRVEATRARAKMLEGHGIDAGMAPQLAGTPEDLVEYLGECVDVGYHHIIAGLLAPYDEETMTRLVSEVRPCLEAMVA